MIDLSSIDVPDMLERLALRNIKVTSGGREVNFSCFKAGHAHGDERPSASVNIEKMVWNCLGCHAKGSVISLVAEVQEVTTADAQRWLRDTYGLEFSEPEGGTMIGELENRLRPRVQEQVRTRPSVGYLSMMRADWHPDIGVVRPGDRPDPSVEEWRLYMVDRGFTAETLTSWDIGYDYWCKRLTIPVFDVDGELVGLKGRAWREGHKPKYDIIGDVGDGTRYGFHPYEASKVVFGLHRHRGLRIAIVFEGELNAIAAEQAMIEHGTHVARATAIGMSYMSHRHAQLLAREVDDVFLFGDPDDAGAGFVHGHVNSSGEREPGAIDLLEPLVSTWVVQGQEHDAAEYVRRGESSTILELIKSARSSVAIDSLSR